MNRILIIEDDASVRRSLIELLTEEGFETYEAENGRIGIEMAKMFYPDLIISDILMPEVDGYGVLEEMQKSSHTSAIPFIFLSARTEAGDIRTGMKIGADDYLTKPYKATDLLDAVNTRLRKKNRSDLRLDDVFKSISMSLPHELRTPLISILGFSQIISEDLENLDPQEISDMAEKINSSGYELLNLIEKFLIYSRLETLNAVKKRYSIVNGSHTDSAKNIISAAFSYLTEKFERTADLKINLADASIKITHEHFHLLVSEILENSIKFSKKGTVLEIKSEVIDRFYFLEIKDHGIGMTKKQIKDVGVLRQFDREKTLQKGTGMGLAIVNKIVEMYSLGFKIESQIQNFTNIKIFIPIK